MVISISKEKIYYELLCLYINLMMVFDCIADIFLFFDYEFTARSVLQKALYIVLCAALILSGEYYVKKLRKSLSLIGVFAVITVASVMVTPEIRSILTRALTIFLIYSIGLIIFVPHIVNFEKFLVCFEKYFVIDIIYSALNILVHNKIEHAYSMSFSYNSFWLSGLALIWFFKRGKLRYLFIYILNLISNLVGGARGGILCNALLFFFCFIAIYHPGRKKTNLLIRTLILIGVLGVGAIAAVISLGDRLLNLRSLFMLSGKSSDFLTGRGAIYAVLWKKILTNPFGFRGILSDRIYLANSFGSFDADFSFTSYAHNFIFEILYQYGLVLGMMILILVVICVVKTLKTVRRKWKQKNSFCIFYVLSLAAAFGQLSFSSSYLNTMNFGLAVAAIMVAMEFEKLDYRKRKFPLDRVNLKMNEVQI